MINLAIVGRITKDAETRAVKVNGVDTFVTDFTVAANEGYGENQQTEYFRVSIWRDRGAKMKASLTKGRIIAVKGVVTARPWTDKDGNARAQLEIRVPEIQFLDKKPGDPDEAPEVGTENDKPF